MKYLRIVIFPFLILLSYLGKTQSFKIDSVQACIGDTASFTISMSTIDSVGAITLFIGYDTSMLYFINLENINPLASGTIFNDMADTGSLRKIAITGTYVYGVNFNSGIFGVLKFIVLAGNCPVHFLNNCEVADYRAEMIDINYLDGNLNVPDIPFITLQPSQLTINTSQNGFCRINALNTERFQWQINQGNGWIDIQNNNTFQGYDNDTLFITQPGDSLDGAYFRCTLSNPCLSIESDSVIIQVTGISVNEHNNLVFKLYPNPFHDFISVDFLKSTFIEEINIYKTDGKFVSKLTKQIRSTHLVINQLIGLEKGVYLFEIVSTNKDAVKVKDIFKLVKE